MCKKIIDVKLDCYCYIVRLETIYQCAKKKKQQQTKPKKKTQKNKQTYKIKESKKKKKIEKKKRAQVRFKNVTNKCVKNLIYLIYFYNQD